MRTVDDLVTWLRAQLDDDERVARAAAALQADPEEGWGIDGAAITPHIGMVHEDEARQHIARHNPARVLAEVDSKRRILELYDVSTSRELKPDAWELMKHAVRALALPYADRPGYHEGWRP